MICLPLVALRKESVDRNLVGCIDRTIDIVALRKESVDRNPQVDTSSVNASASLSARRAWIEIVRGMSLLRKITSRSPQGERG